MPFYSALNVNRIGWCVKTLYFLFCSSVWQLAQTCSYFLRMILDPLTEIVSAQRAVKKFNNYLIHNERLTKEITVMK